MNPIAKLLLVACALLPCWGIAAPVFKCTDATGKVTYSGTKCAELGLKDAGEIRDRINVQPAYQPPSSENEPRRRYVPPPPPPPRVREPETPPAAADQANPERRCFTVHTEKGNVTRCNDKPAE